MIAFANLTVLISSFQTIVCADHYCKWGSMDYVGDKVIEYNNQANSTQSGLHLDRNVLVRPD